MKERGAEAGVGLVGEAREQRRQVELVRRRDRKERPIGRDGAVLLGETFEPHRRLALERHAALHAEQAAGGVEPAAEAARLRCV